MLSHSFLTLELRCLLERIPRRLFLLDMLLGNPDRLPCEALGWRGNPHNILYCQGGTHAGRMVAIDSAVQRRPPGALASEGLLLIPLQTSPIVPGTRSLYHSREV